ncbi:MAG TPA: glycosyltransferase [Roseiflexaceae bacterium]|nr:glycosyltransferase [Roseiflexaceae bacterium]
MFMLQVAVVQGQGGISTAVAHYERMFKAQGVNSAVLFRGPAMQRLRDEGFDVIEAPDLLTSPLGGLLPVFGAVRSAVTARAGADPVTLIVHSDRTLPALRQLFPGARVVTPCHSDKFKHKTHADLVVTLNAAQHAMAQRALPRGRIALLGNPYVAQPAAPPVETGAPRVNFVARFIPTKDPMTLMRAAAQTRDKLQFRFIGAGPLEADLRTAAQTLGVNASFPGWLPAPFAEFHRNDILVLPSHWEGLPYLLQEALDHTAPIIASDNAGNRAALNDGAFGLLFPTGDAAALAQAIDRAVADLDALRLMSEKGRSALHERYGAAAFWLALQRAWTNSDHVGLAHPLSRPH